MLNTCYLIGKMHVLSDTEYDIIEIKTSTSKNYYNYKFRRQATCDLNFEQTLWANWASTIQVWCTQHT